MKKFKEFKEKFAKSLPQWEVDQINHYQVANFLAMIVSLFSVVSKHYLVGVIGIIIIMAVAIAWEVYTLVQDKFSKESVKESTNDLWMAIFAVFGYFTILLILHTQN